MRIKINTDYTSTYCEVVYGSVEFYEIHLLIAGMGRTKTESHYLNVSCVNHEPTAYCCRCENDYCINSLKLSTYVIGNWSVINNKMVEKVIPVAYLNSNSKDSHLR